MPLMEHECQSRIEWCSGGERGGLGGVRGLGEELVEVVAGELPLERRCDLLVAAAEGQQLVLEHVEVGEVVGCEDLALDDGEVDLGLLSQDAWIGVCG